VHIEGINLGVHRSNNLLRECNWRAFGAKISGIAASRRGRRQGFGRNNYGARFRRRSAQHAHDVPAGNGKYICAAPAARSKLLHAVKRKFGIVERGARLDNCRIRRNGRRVRGHNAYAIEISAETDALDTGNALDMLDVLNNREDGGTAGAADGGIGVAFAGAE
jgi:hypothetical protein